MTPVISYFMFAVCFMKRNKKHFVDSSAEGKSGGRNRSGTGRKGEDNGKERRKRILKFELSAAKLTCSIN